MKHLGTKKIETNRLILRPFVLDDAADMYKNWANDGEVTKFLTWPTHPNIDISKKITESWVEEYEKENYYQWCIEWKSSHEAIGSISVVHINEDTQAVEVGYCIGRSFWNQGITSEALSAVISFFFNEVKANRIEARHDINNPNSGYVMRKCGMKPEGIRRQGDKNNTGICDTACYGILAEDYNRSKTN